MPGLMIKDLPEGIHLLLKKRAAAHRRSIGKEALSILEEGLRDRAGPPSLAEIDELRVKGRRPLTQRLLDQARTAGRP